MYRRLRAISSRGARGLRIPGSTTALSEIGVVAVHQQKYTYSKVPGWIYFVEERQPPILKYRY